MLNGTRPLHEMKPVFIRAQNKDPVIKPLCADCFVPRNFDLQSHEGLIRVFPATPNDWPAAFTLKARGGFLVSSQKQKGAPAGFVLIKSLLGNECRLANPWPDREVFVKDLRTGGKQPHAITGVMSEDWQVLLCHPLPVTRYMLLTQPTGVREESAIRNPTPSSFGK